MENINSNNLATKDDIKDIKNDINGVKDTIKQEGEKMEGKWNTDLALLSKIVATKEDLEKLASKKDLEDLASKKDLEDLEIKLTDEISNAKTGLAGELVTKSYLDKKLSALEEKIIGRILREKSKLKDALVLVMGILRKGQKPTQQEIETLSFLEQEWGVSKN